MGDCGLLASYRGGSLPSTLKPALPANTLVNDFAHYWSTLLESNLPHHSTPHTRKCSKQSLGQSSLEAFADWGCTMLRPSSDGVVTSMSS